MPDELIKNPVLLLREWQLLKFSLIEQLINKIRTKTELTNKECQLFLGKHRPIGTPSRASMRRTNVQKR